MGGFLYNTVIITASRSKRRELLEHKDGSGRSTSLRKFEVLFREIGSPLSILDEKSSVIVLSSFAENRRNYYLHLSGSGRYTSQRKIRICFHGLQTGSKTNLC